MSHDLLSKETNIYHKISDFHMNSFKKRNNQNKNSVLIQSSRE